MSEFRRTEPILRDIISKINKLIEIYAKKEKLDLFLDQTSYIVSVDLANPQTAQFEVKVYTIDVASFCFKSKDVEIKKYYEIMSSFASEYELTNLLCARYFPEYLTVKNIISILLYQVPRKVKRLDFEHLNLLYNKYKVEFDDKNA